MAREATQKYARKMRMIEKRHFRKHGKRRMALAELDALCGAKRQ